MLALAPGDGVQFLHDVRKKVKCLADCFKSSFWQLSRLKSGID
jgi:hypothetical protein